MSRWAPAHLPACTATHWFSQSGWALHRSDDHLRQRVMLYPQQRQPRLSEVKHTCHASGLIADAVHGLWPWQDWCDTGLFLWRGCDMLWATLWCSKAVSVILHHYKAFYKLLRASTQAWSSLRWTVRTRSRQGTWNWNNNILDYMCWRELLWVHLIYIWRFLKNNWACIFTNPRCLT